MSAWDSARKLLSNAVVNHLGEQLALSHEDYGDLIIRGVLTSPEALARLGLVQDRADMSRLAMRRTDAPDWLLRSVRRLKVTSESGDRYGVTSVVDNGEGMLELWLCRSA